MNQSGWLPAFPAVRIYDERGGQIGEYLAKYKLFGSPANRAAASAERGDEVGHMQMGTGNRLGYFQQLMTIALVQITFL
jgi:hypothetical protein